MITSFLGQVVAAFREKGVLVDSNLLLLLFVGGYDKNLIPRFKRTAKYSAEDWELLTSFLAPFEHVLTTPHVLTEVSNLAGQLTDPARAACLGGFANHLEVVEERFHPATRVAALATMARFGLTDSAVTLIAGDALVLTDDLPLYGLLTSQGHICVNFNHLRTNRWFG